MIIIYVSHLSMFQALIEDKIPYAAIKLKKAEGKTIRCNSKRGENTNSQWYLYTSRGWFFIFFYIVNNYPI